MSRALGLVLLVTLPLLASCACPFAAQQQNVMDVMPTQPVAPPAQLADFSQVKQDVIAMLTKSQDFWPADVFNGQPHYGPFLIRQAWHCAGSYRTYDGRGGCDGARQRFDPERSWDDNTNLDKAKQLLYPIKVKYGAGLSWGDLIIFAANVAIEQMKGPAIPFCAGRIDDANGADSTLLGPNAEQAQAFPCLVDGDCQLPFGATTLGLIYVNPAGPMGNGVPEQSAPQIRDTFGRMAMNDSETVALIGGGHAFGKAHGSCPFGAGMAPKFDPAHSWDSWPTMCTQPGNTTTSGFEGPWTTNPIQWGNQYFTNLQVPGWVQTTTPAGQIQWRNPTLGNIMMLTSDRSLMTDTSYSDWVDMYAKQPDLLTENFKNAWYKLTTRDMGPITRCRQVVGAPQPVPQEFQFPLPAPTQKQLAFDWTPVRNDIVQLIHPASQVSGFPGDVDAANQPYYGAMFVQLAYLCSATYRRTDYMGGCNGARIRFFATNLKWKEFTGMDQVLALLQPIQTKYGADSISLADLIIYAGNVALADAGGFDIGVFNFIPGRVDAPSNDGGWDNLYYTRPMSYNISDAGYNGRVRRHVDLMGLTIREYVALMGRPRSAQLMGLQQYTADTWSVNPAKFTNEYYSTLINNNWVPYQLANGLTQYQAFGTQQHMTPADLNLIGAGQEDYFLPTQQYAYDMASYQADFIAAWTKLTNADRFDITSGSASSSNVPAVPGTQAPSTPLTSKPAFVAGISVAATALVAGAVFFFCVRKGESDTSGNYRQM